MSKRVKGRMMSEVTYIRGAMPGLEVGCRVNYIGDVCNQPKSGTVSAVFENRWGHNFTLTYDDGTAETYEHSVFGGIGPRFILAPRAA
jgi:hypothetical protein